MHSIQQICHTFQLLQSSGFHCFVAYLVELTDLNINSATVLFA